jgi:ferrous iron transport protein A
MHDMLADPAPVAAPAISAADDRLVRLSLTRPGDAGVIVDVRAETEGGDHGVGVEELQRRLLEFGFVEGARVRVLHEGAVRRDPIAVQVDDLRVALRRRDAQDVWVMLDHAPAHARSAKRR